MLFTPRPDFKRKRGALPPTERFFLTLFVIGIIGVLHLYLTLRVARGSAEKELAGFSYEFSSHSFYDPKIDPGLAFDGDLGTAWEDYPPPKKLQGTDSKKRLDSATPPEGRLYIQKEAGKTHYPGAPPILWLPVSLEIHSGSVNRKEDPYYALARPRKVRIVFFYQDVVDVDREYRFPGSPRYAGETTARLSDTPEPQRINLDFLPNPGPSPGFPENLFTIYYRIEILSTYPGKKEEDRIAIREIVLNRPDPKTITE